MSAPAPSMFTPTAKAVAEKLGLKKGRANLEEFADTLQTLATADRNIVAVTSDSRGSGKLAPYGKAAVQVLQKLDLWPALQGKIVLGENIAQTTQYVSTGAAQAGITALSLALAPELATRVRYVLLPDALHAPVRQRMVLLKNAGPAARAFYEFLQSPAAKAVLTRYGYV